MIGPAADDTPPGRYISGEGYAHYQVRSNGDRKTVQEHQLVMLMEGADPEKVFSNGAWHINHKWAANDGSRLTELLKQFNFPDNLELLKNDDHGFHTNGDTDPGGSAVETGPDPPVQAERIAAVKDAIATHEERGEKGAPWGAVAAYLAAKDIDEDDAEAALDHLRKRGEVYEPAKGYYRTT